MNVKQMIRISLAALFVAAIAAFAASVQAATVPVSNGSFEDFTAVGDGVTGAGWGSFPGAAGGMIANAIPLDDEFYTNPATFGSGWQSNGPAGTNGKYGLQHPDDQYYERDGSHHLVAPLAGDFIGFVNMDDGDGFDQEVQSGVLGNLIPGMKYVLKVGVGARPRTGHDWNDVKYDITLVANPTPGDGMNGHFGSSGGTILGTPSSVILESPTTNAPNGGSGVADLMYMFTATTSDPYAVRIAMQNTQMQNGIPDPNAPISGGTNSRFTQGNFDNVRLDAVPEPASAVLAAFGIVAVGTLVRRRK